MSREEQSERAKRCICPLTMQAGKEPLQCRGDDCAAWMYDPETPAFTWERPVGLLFSRYETAVIHPAIPEGWYCSAFPRR